MMLVVKASMFETRNLELAQEREHSYDVLRKEGNTGVALYVALPIHISAQNEC